VSAQELNRSFSGRSVSKVGSETVRREFIECYGLEVLIVDRVRTKSVSLFTFKSTSGKVSSRSHYSTTSSQLIHGYELVSVGCSSTNTLLGEHDTEAVSVNISALHYPNLTVKANKGVL